MMGLGTGFSVCALSHRWCVNAPPNEEFVENYDVSIAFAGNDERRLGSLTSNRQGWAAQHVVCPQ